MAISGRYVRGSRGSRKTVSTIYFDKTQSDPAQIISGDVNQGVIVDILARMRRCLGKYTANGEMTICYLHGQDSTYYYDGSRSDLTGLEGDVFVYLPEFFYKFHDETANIRALSFSLTQQDSTWKKSPAGLVGAFLMPGSSANGGAAKSTIDGAIVLGGGSVSSNTNFDTLAASRGVGYTTTDYEMHSAMAFLFYAKHGTFKASDVLGDATTLDITGTTATYGNADVASDNGGGISGSFNGIEMPYHHYGERLSGICGK